MGEFKDGHRVLYVAPAPTDEIPREVVQLRESVGAQGSVEMIFHSQLSQGRITKPESSYNAVISIASSAVDHQAGFLFELARILKPSGFIILREPLLQNSTSQSVESCRTDKDMESALLIAGFTSTRIEHGHAGTQIYSAKPDWEIGAAASLSLPKSKTASGGPVWSLSSDDTVDSDLPTIKPSAGSGMVWKLDGGDGDLIEDDALLEKEDLARPEKGFDCGTSANGKRKACKNCSCGLAEELDAGKEIKKKTPEQASACGNCSLGDAFRCASCPYLGLPAFKPGEKVSLVE